MTTEEKHTTVQNKELNNGLLYTGSIDEEGRMDGEGKLVYPNKDALSGRFRKGIPQDDMVYIISDSGDTFTGSGSFDNNYQFMFDYGTYTYSKNKRTYKGHFVNNLFEDKEAIFSFGTGTSYVGPFKAGTNIGQTGTMFYPPSVMKGEGVWWIKGKMISLGKIEGNTIVKGFIRFNDRSTYEGDIYYDGNNGYYRKGLGVQDFHECNYSADIIGGPKDEYLYKYVGEFDYTISQWIYGNGIMYFSDINQQPTSYLPGFYTSLKLLKDYVGDESTISLLDGYTPSMKTTYHPQQTRVELYQAEYRNQEHSIVFAGDSYFDMWHSSYQITSYEDDMKGYDSCNVGIGGTIAEEWKYMAENLILPYAKDQVVFHLGFNDLHMGASVEESITSLKAIIELLRMHKPNLRFYLLAVEPSPAFSAYLVKEKELNSRYQELAESDPKISFINTASLFMDGEALIKDLSSYFISDQVHMNKKGYDNWVSLIKESLKS